MVEAFKKQCGISSSKDTLHAPPIKKGKKDTPQNTFPQHPVVDVVSFKDQQQKDSSVSEDLTDQDIQSPLNSSNIARSCT